MAKVGINKNLFEILAGAQDKGLTNAALAEKTGIYPTLLSMWTDAVSSQTEFWSS